MQATVIGSSLVTEAFGNGFASIATPLRIGLRCPRCTADLTDCECRQCGFHIRNIHGIFHALPPERIAYYARFIEEYERIRSAEGRGSNSDEYYLGLPHSDASRKNSAQWVIRARSFDCLLHRVLKPGLPPGGRILDLGSGNCWMSYRLALAGYSPCAVDLLTNDLDGLGAAEHYRRYLPEFFPRFRAELVYLPFHSEQFDAVVFNASFHYAEIFETVLQEALRCSKKDGIVIISDTPWYSSDIAGKQMVAERHAEFLRKYGTASASINSMEYLTDERLSHLEARLRVQWTVYSPNYGIRWALRPWTARLCNRREPARFRIYVAQRISR